MTRLSIMLLPYALLWVGLSEYCTSENIDIMAYEPSTISEDNEPSLISMGPINKAIENIEQLSSALKSRREGIEESVKMYDEMNTNYGVLIKILANSNNAYEFLNAKGLDRVIITNIGTPYTPLQTNILILLKTLFEVAPSTTMTVMPARMIDKILDIFVNNDKVDVKARVIDILHIWLPENPRVQARVMKVKGLVPFYEQMSKLDHQSVRKLLYLFIKILQEHLDAYNDYTHKNTKKRILNADDVKFYQRSGLLELMSRKEVCVGLFHIFESTWQSFSPENDLIVPVFVLSGKIAPFCFQSFKGIPRAPKLFEDFLKYFKEQNRDEYFLNFGLNAAEIEAVITDYVMKFRQANEIKDEF